MERTVTVALVAAVVLVAVFAHRLGVHVGMRRGFTEGFELARIFAEEDADEEYVDHFGGLIDAGRRREN